MVDCSLLTYKTSLYLLPTLAIAEAIILPEGYTLNRDSSIVGVYDWRKENQPILTLDLLPLNDTQIRHPKIALLYNMQPQGAQRFFAVLFEGQTRRIKISSENIAWADESKQMAILAEKKSHAEVTLVDLTRLSKEAVLTSSKAQIAK